MTFHVVEPFGSITLPAGHNMKIQLNTESLTTLLRSNLSCHMNKPLTQELMEELTKQIIESIDYFINKREDIL